MTWDGSSPKFTAADVVVGATVTIQQVTTYPLRTVTATTHGVVREVENGSALITDEVDQERYWIDLVRTPDAITVEILDVQPPKPECVVGGIYRIHTQHQTTYLWKRVDGGFVAVEDDARKAVPVWSDEWCEEQGFAVGDRVLVIDYPNDDAIEYANSWNTVAGSPARLIADALKAESEARS